MRGVFQIAKFSGIPVHLHWSFSFIFIWIFYLGQTGEVGWTGITWLVLFIVAMFVCVAMHEFGHALSARRFGLGTKDIILSPVGGMARLERLPDKPIQEFFVALAGPMVNIIIALFLGIGLFFYAPSSLNIFKHLGGGIGMLSNFNTFLALLFWLNVMLFAFNLVPAFPMDGGRIFRSLLSIKYGQVTATRIAALVAQGLAVIFIMISIYYYDIIIGLMGVFVIFVARHEYKMVKVENILKAHKAGDVARSFYTKINLSDPISHPFELVNKGLEKNFLVFDELGEIKGMLYEKDVIDAMKSKKEHQPVSDFYKAEFSTINAENSLRAAYTKMMESGYNILPVVEKEEIVGVIDVGNLSSFIQIQSKVQ